MGLRPSINRPFTSLLVGVMLTRSLNHDPRYGQAAPTDQTHEGPFIEGNWGASRRFASDSQRGPLYWRRSLTPTPQSSRMVLTIYASIRRSLRFYLREAWSRCYLRRKRLPWYVSKHAPPSRQEQIGLVCATRPTSPHIHVSAILLISNYVPRGLTCPPSALSSQG